MKSTDVIAKASKAPLRFQVSMTCARWLLDHPRLGQGLPAQRLASQLLKRPARLGMTEAQSRLGDLLSTAGCSGRDRLAGIAMLRDAAQHGDTDAQFRLGVLLLNGNAEQAVDVLQARHWLEAASQQGHEQAQSLLLSLQAQRVTSR
ncbi:Sel1 repeat-containing protein [Atopomonas hussainii]|uniref:Sel1 repeat-containing protein n=2 Tax=Atopomonas hussainii TaxID=1429083 RepID=A0A1H7S366_9GAMM|nr:Sel1 repeat-containing protein [Atopomonas hussainii]